MSLLQIKQSPLAIINDTSSSFISGDLIFTNIKSEYSKSEFECNEYFLNILNENEVQTQVYKTDDGKFITKDLYLVIPYIPTLRSVKTFNLIISFELISPIKIERYSSSDFNTYEIPNFSETYKDIFDIKNPKNFLYLGYMPNISQVFQNLSFLTKYYSFIFNKDNSTNTYFSTLNLHNEKIFLLSKRFNNNIIRQGVIVPSIFNALTSFMISMYYSNLSVNNNIIYSNISTYINTILSSSEKYFTNLDNLPSYLFISSQYDIDAYISLIANRNNLLSPFIFSDETSIDTGFQNSINIYFSLPKFPKKLKDEYLNIKSLRLNLREIFQIIYNLNVVNSSRALNPSILSSDATSLYSISDLENVYNSTILVSSSNYNQITYKSNKLSTPIDSNTTQNSGLKSIFNPEVNIFIIPISNFNLIETKLSLTDSTINALDEDTIEIIVSPNMDLSNLYLFCPITLVDNVNKTYMITELHNVEQTPTEKKIILKSKGIGIYLKKAQKLGYTIDIYAPIVIGKLSFISLMKYLNTYYIPVRTVIAVKTRVKLSNLDF